jgi:hypothetical protein
MSRYMLLLVLLCTSMLGQDAVNATHLLGFDAARRNATGALSVEGDSLQFAVQGQPSQKVAITSIQDIAVGDESRQVGGVPLMLGKAAIPFAGGRVVSLFSHKSYDTLTLEYADANGAYHAAVFRLARGRGDALKQTLMAKGAHVSAAPASATPAAAEVKSEKN